MSPPSPKRPSTVGDRDVRTPYTSAKGTDLAAVPEVVDERKEATGVLQGDALWAERRKRPTEERIERLEVRGDAHDRRHAEVIDRIGKVEVAVAGVGGKMEILPRLVESLQDATRTMQATHAAQVQIDVAEKIDVIDERKAGRTALIERWKFAGKVAALVGAAVEILHRTGIL